MPITSYGIIVSRTKEDSGEKEFLLIRRKDTVSYVVFLRGLYTQDMIIYLAQRMTKKEREKIKNSSFDELWEGLWKHHPSRRYHHRQKFKKQRERAKEKFEKREWESVFDMIFTKYTEPEWGFPKGRKKKSETALKAALREFCEETGFNEGNIIVNKSRPPIKERYTATDSKQYEILYFRAEMKDSTIDPPEIDSSFRSSEISKIGWFTKEKALEKIRDYHVAKRNIISKLV
jgi:predicted NUDIX family NTP pyrophosphohydrolase